MNAFQSRLSPIHPFHFHHSCEDPLPVHVSISPESHPPFPHRRSSRAISCRMGVSISPESHPPFPQQEAESRASRYSLFQSRLSPIHPFHALNNFKNGSVSAQFQSRLSPIHPFHNGYAPMFPGIDCVSLSPVSHPPFPQVR